MMSVIVRIAVGDEKGGWRKGAGLVLFFSFLFFALLSFVWDFDEVVQP